MITASTQVTLTREADNCVVWQGALVDYFLDYGLREPRAVLAILEALQTGQAHQHMGGVGFVLRMWRLI